MYPPTLNARPIEQQAAAGQVQVSPADLPLVLLIWGKSRVVPVKLTSFAVAEEAFDTRLNPIAAKVELGMQVLTYMEFTDSSIGRDAFIAYQKSKETLAQHDTPGSHAARHPQPAAALSEPETPMFFKGSRYEKVPDASTHRRDAAASIALQDDAVHPADAGALVATG